MCGGMMMAVNAPYDIGHGTGNKRANELKIQEAVNDEGILRGVHESDLRLFEP